jgi:hypothetical protein
MPKKDKKSKKDDKNGTQDAVETVRSAIERTFQATAEGAAGTQKRTRELVDEVARAAARIRETIEDLKVLDDLKGIRDELEGLARRVKALETRDGQSAKPATAAKPAATAAATRRRTTAASKASASKPKTTASRAKSSGTKSTGTRARSTSARSTGSRSTGSRSRTS